MDLVTAGERHFVRAVRDVQARYELLLAEERERSDRHAATVAERDQRIAALRVEMRERAHAAAGRVRDALVLELRKALAAQKRRAVQLEAGARGERKTAAGLRAENTELRRENARLRRALTVKRAPAPAIRPLSQRFWAKVIVHPNGCWLWTGSATKNGYGRISVGGATTDAHRAAFIVTGRDLPAALKRGCDERTCVNPDHWVTYPTHRVAKGARDGNAA